MNQKKIAELSNVSVSTVSKALSSSKEISEELADKIKKIAIETGYFKEKSKRKLEYEKQKSAIIAVICPEIISIHYSSIVSFVKKAVEAMGGQLAVYIYDFDDSKLHKIIEMLVLKKAADGIILISSSNLRIKPKIPLVYFGNPNCYAEYDTITEDIQILMNDAISYLKDMGHINIGYVGETLTITKRDAFKNAFISNRLPIHDDFIYTINKRFEEIGYCAARAMIKSNSFPTAIVAAYDEIALSMIHEFQNNGIRIPEDISIIGINDIPSSSYAQVPLTTFNVFEDNKYYSAIEILLDKIFNETKTVSHIHVNHRLILRKSVKRNTIM